MNSELKTFEKWANNYKNQIEFELRKPTYQLFFFLIILPLSFFLFVVNFDVVTKYIIDWVFILSYFSIVILFFILGVKKLGLNLTQRDLLSLSLFRLSEDFECEKFDQKNKILKDLNLFSKIVEGIELKNEDQTNKYFNSNYSKDETLKIYLINLSQYLNSHYKNKQINQIDNLKLRNIAYYIKIIDERVFQELKELNINLNNNPSNKSLLRNTFQQFPIFKILLFVMVSFIILFSIFKNYRNSIIASLLLALSDIAFKYYNQNKQRKI